MAAAPAGAGRAGKKTLEAYRWLTRYYGEHDAGVPDLPERVNFHHPVEQVARMIQLLDLSSWNWTPQEILSMPEDWAEDLLAARYCGWIIGEQSRAKPGQ